MNLLMIHQWHDFSSFKPRMYNSF